MMNDDDEQDYLDDDDNMSYYSYEIIKKRHLQIPLTNNCVLAKRHSFFCQTRDQFARACAPGQIKIR
jgi:hypothetical protein